MSKEKAPLNLKRYKKSKDGLLDFVSMLEQASESVRNNILAQVEKGDPEFFEQVRKKMIHFEDLAYLDELVLTEVLSAIPPKVLAFSLYGLSDEIKERFLKQLGFRESKMVEEEADKIDRNKAASIRKGAQKKVLQIVRELERKGKLAIDSSDIQRPENKKIA